MALREYILTTMQVLYFDLNPTIITIILFSFACLPCIFGIPACKGLLYTANALFFGICGAFCADRIGVPRHFCITGFVLFAFFGIVCTHFLLFLFKTILPKGHPWMEAVLSIMWLPWMTALRFHGLVIIGTALCMSAGVYFACASFRNAKREFYTYEDLYRMPYAGEM